MNSITSNDNQSGFLEILLFFILGFVSLIGITLFIALFCKGQDAGTNTAERTKDTGTVTNSLKQVDHSLDSNSNALPNYANDPELSTGSLTCVYLPGLPPGRTSALDSRVARKWLAVKQDLDSQGIVLSVNWGFRTSCQQKYVKAGRNLKAAVGQSPHEAARALDISGMQTRNDAQQIIATFRKHGWRWLGEADPPHFEVPVYLYGEKSNYTAITKAQEYYNNGGPVGGCRGAECAQ